MRYRHRQQGILAMIASQLSCSKSVLSQLIIRNDSACDKRLFPQYNPFKMSQPDHKGANWDTGDAFDERSASCVQPWGSGLAKSAGKLDG